MSRLEPQTIDLPGGAHIEYLETGVSEGQSIVYLHGAGGVFRNAAFMPALGQTFRVLAPSRPGYDGSTGPSENARDDAEIMAELIRQLVDGPVHVIAESAGGAAGCWLAILHPELVGSLTLVATGAFAAHAPAPASRPSAEEMELRLFGPHPAWSEPPTDEDRNRRQRNAAQNSARMRPTDDNADLLERLSEIAAPTLVLWGTADQLYPPEAGHVFVQRIPNSYRILIYGGAHSLPVAACRQFVALVTDFIERGDRFVVNEIRAALPD